MAQVSLIFWLLLVQVRAPIQRFERSLQPPPPSFARFEVDTRSIPRARIAGVVLPARGRPRGTLFVCHGWGSRKEFMYGLDWIRRDLGWNLVLFDFREHGRSSHSMQVCTLGYHEIWDVKATIDYAQQQGLAEPYAILGHSLGGSVGLRWATHDPRVRGVLAVSPYRNGLEASRQFLRAWIGVDLAKVQTRRGLVKMLEVVDLPTDVKRRNDLRIWVMVGQHDIFPEAQQREILDASPSPPRLKRLYVIPGGYHHTLWMWRGDARVPSHDQIIRDFLREVGSK